MCIYIYIYVFIYIYIYIWRRFVDGPATDLLHENVM